MWLSYRQRPFPLRFPSMRSLHAVSPFLSETFGVTSYFFTSPCHEVCPPCCWSRSYHKAIKRVWCGILLQLLSTSCPTTSLCGWPMRTTSRSARPARSSFMEEVSARSPFQRLVQEDAAHSRISSMSSSLSLFSVTPHRLSSHVPKKPVRVTAFNPWKKRPGGGLAGQLHGRPQMIHPHYFRNGYRQANPDDPSRLLSPNHVLLKRCPVCKRTKYTPLSQKDYYHTCCEGQVMRLWTTMRTVMNSEHKLLQAVRQWDVENERPWSNAHRPKPKGRSKLKKR